VSNLKKLLSRVNNIVENSNPGTLNEIKNISNILEVNGKVATVLHFVNKDSNWNPHTLTLLDDLLKEEKLTDGGNQEKMDFYLVNYLDKNWKDLVIKRLMAAKGLNFVSTWLSPIMDVIVDDVTKLGLYPDEGLGGGTSGAGFKNYKQLFGDSSMFLYGPFVDWVHGVVKSEEKDGLVVQQNSQDRIDRGKSSRHFFDVTPTGEYDRDKGGGY